MNKTSLSKSSYCSGVQCEKILWLREYKPKLAQEKGNDAILETGKDVGEFAKGLFGDYTDIPYENNQSAMIENTRKALAEKPNIITEASFAYENNFCRVDILKNDPDGVEIYEVKSTTDFKKIDLNDPAYQYYVLSNIGLNVKKVSVVYLNNEYRRGKELDMNQLFTITDVTDVALEKQDEIRANIDGINSFMDEYGEDDEPQTDIGMHCFKPYECDFWEYCTRNLPKPNVFDIKGRMKKTAKFDKYYEGKISFEDLENEDLNPKYLEQIDFTLNNREPKIEKGEIKGLLDSLKYPLYFIDYEAFQHAIPEYEGTKPYQQIPFQYSLHIIKEEGAPIEHQEYLAEVGDENIVRNFAESMINALPEDGSVIVYNKTFEQSLVNNKLAEMYPDLKDEIERINGNIVDIMVPFSKRNYYTKEMEGSYSIKKVLPALYPDDPELDYTNLNLVHKGDEASNAFLSLKDKTPEEQAEVREALLRYCELDTLAMVKIWQKFREVTGDV